MKLLGLSIENFGKLSGLSLQFTDGINIINEDNGWGKSTLAAFLKVMFYGMDARKEAGAFEKERNLYRPWQGGTYGGQLDFEVNGKKYRISRTFGRTEKTDTFHLYDLATNLESRDYSKEIGLELFDLDSASFKRSIYIAQNDCASETSDHINAKLGNLAENTDDINNFESAGQHLKEILNQLNPSRATGSIKKRKNYITQLTQELHSYEAAESGFSGIQEKERIVTSQIKELLAIRKNYADALVVASEESRKKELRIQYDAMCKEVSEKEEKKELLQPVFPNGVPEAAVFQKQKQNAREMEMVKSGIQSSALTEEESRALDKLEHMFEKEKPTESDIDAALQMFVEIDRQKDEIARQESKLSMYAAMMEEKTEEPKFEGSMGHKIFLFAGIILALLGGAGLLMWYLKAFPMIEPLVFMALSLVALIAGGIFAVIGIVQGNRVRKKKKEWEEARRKEQSETKEKHDSLSTAIAGMKEDVRKVYGTIGQFLGNYRVYCEVGEYQPRLYELKNQLQQFERLTAKSQNHKSQTEIYEQLQAYLKDFEQQYGFEIEGDASLWLNELENKAMEYKHACSVYREALDKKEAFEKRQKMSFWTREAVCPYSLDELNGMIAQADDKLEELKNAKSQYLKQLEDLQEQLDLRDEKKAELSELLELQEQEMQKYKIIKLTQEYLVKAKEQFTAKYMGPISSGFSKYYAMLTGDTEQNWVIDANINLKIREKGELRDVQWFSAGYQDLIGVCMRLALVDAMYQDEKPFLILDDPFVNLDKEKAAHGNKLLLSVAEEYQVIYFTCHDSRCPM